MATLASSGRVAPHWCRPTVQARGAYLCCPSTSAMCTLGQNLARCPRTTLEVGRWLRRASSTVLVQRARHCHVAPCVVCVLGFSQLVVLAAARRPPRPTQFGDFPRKDARDARLPPSMPVCVGARTPTYQFQSCSNCEVQHAYIATITKLLLQIISSVFSPAGGCPTGCWSPYIQLPLTHHGSCPENQPRGTKTHIACACTLPLLTSLPHASLEMWEGGGAEKLQKTVQ